MNLIPEIAKMLGVEIREEFKIWWNGCTEPDSLLYRFTENRFEYHEDDDEWDVSLAYTDLISGIAKVVKIPFEPKKDEHYFIVSVIDKTVWSYTWSGTTTDYCFKACGNCFRTKAEAEKHKYEIYEKLTGRKWEEK